MVRIRKASLSAGEITVLGKTADEAWRMRGNSWLRSQQHKSVTVYLYLSPSAGSRWGAGRWARSASHEQSRSWTFPRLYKIKRETKSWAVVEKSRPLNFVRSTSTGSADRSQWRENFKKNFGFKSFIFILFYSRIYYDDWLDGWLVCPSVCVLKFLFNFFVLLKYDCNLRERERKRSDKRKEEKNEQFFWSFPVTCGGWRNFISC